MKREVFGQPIAAIDVERLPREGGPVDFVRLCGSLIGAALAERVGSFTLPEISERVDVPDGGVDARYTAPVAADITETGGLVGPGTTVYQFKYRDTASGTRNRLLRSLVDRLRRDLRRAPPRADRYVLMANVDLSAANRRRLREAIVEVHPDLGSGVVVWGAAEIAQALNAAPRIRHIFFSRGGLISLDTAEAELRAAYESIGWPAFVDREEERRAVQAFAGNPAARYLEVVGAPYAGRTRLVIEALKEHGAIVLWASEPEAATLDLFRELDSHEAPGIVVVDRCTPMALREIRARAESRLRLKTIAVSTGGEKEIWRPGSGRVVVDAVPYGEAERLIRGVLPRVAPRQESWIIEASGRIPGLILHVAALIRDGALSPTSDPDTVRHRLGELLRERYLAELTPEARTALDVASVMSALGVEGDVKHELDAVSEALGVGQGTFERARYELRDRGLIKLRGRFVEVTPPRLGDEIALLALSRSPTAVPELMLHLSPPAVLRFLERFRNLPGDSITKMPATIFGVPGWFPDLAALERGEARFRTLAPAAPGAALGCCERLLGPLSPEELVTRVTGDFRRSLVSALDDLALGSRTFSGAARLLLGLAETEHDTHGEGASRAFVALFHWSHPEVSAPLPLRLELLEEASRAALPVRRAIVAKACGMAFHEYATIFHHDAKGARVPEEPGRPGTWEDVRRYARGVLAVLDRLLVDDVPGVRDGAVEALLEIVGPAVEMSLLPGGLDPLCHRALDLMETAGWQATFARRRADVVTRLELIVERLRERTAAIGERVASVSTATERARAIIEALTTRDLRDRLWHQLGPRTWGQEDGEASLEQTVSAIRSLAADLIASPDGFVEELPWLTSEDAEHRSSLFREVGRQDRGERLLDPLIEKPGDPCWAQALAAYFQGWHEAAPDEAAHALDALIASQPDLSAGTLAAAVDLPTSSETLGRIRAILRHGRLRRTVAARQITFGLRWEQLTAQDTLELIEAVDDQTTETRAALLRAFWLRVIRGAELTARLESLGWSFLETTVPVDEERVRDSGWDALAAKFGERDSKRLMSLFEGLLRESLAAGRSSFQPTEELPRTWRAVLRAERPRVLETLLEINLTVDAPFWIDWTLSKVIRPEEDRSVLVAFVERVGLEGARAVADVLDAAKPGFWGVARDLVARWGDDAQFAARVGSRVLTGAWSGSALGLISERVQSARVLLSDADPKVVRWAHQVLDSLEAWREHAVREDREEWIWDQPVSRAELEGMLNRKDAPERLWAIGRLLKDAPESRVADLLGPEEILDALPRLGHLDERTRQKWDAWARQHWRNPH